MLILRVGHEPATPRHRPFLAGHLLAPNSPSSLELLPYSTPVVYHNRNRPEGLNNQHVMEEVG